MRLLRVTIASLFVTLAAGCSLFSGGGRTPAGPTPMPVPSPSPLPAAVMTFNLTPPAGTPSNADVALVLLDEVTGFGYNTTVMPMQRLTDGRWTVQTAAPAGAVLRYRYTRREPEAAGETDARGNAVLYRLARITGPGQVDDIAAGWADAPYQGPTGRIVGNVYDALTGEFLPEIIVNAGGVQAVSDGEGYFRIDGLPPGTHRITAISPDGAYYPFDQGAVVAADSATPVDLGMVPAPEVQVGFEVTVPADTSPGAPVRIAGNLLQLGHLFTALPGDASTLPARLPVMTQLDATNFIYVATLHAGTDLRYKYTLGDGLWNAERTAEGAFLTRRIILPEENVILTDTVSTWRAGESAAIRIHVTTPDETPPGDRISIQLHPFTWFEPLPMVRLASNEWFFAIHGPLEPSGQLGYRYCRNFACGSADDSETAASTTTGRPLSPSPSLQELRDTVSSWRWLEDEPVQVTVVAPDIEPIAGFDAGVEIVPAYRPSWPAVFAQAVGEIAAGGANSLTLTPPWILEHNAPQPGVVFVPSASPFSADLREMISEALGAGLRVGIRPSLVPASGDLASWWSGAPRDPGWWDLWFEQYRSLALTYARIAAETGVARLILGGPEAAYAFPGSHLADGAPTFVPPDAEDRWRSILSEVREIYHGRLALEIDFSGDSPLIPPFLDAADEVSIYWHVPLSDEADATLAEMQEAAGLALDRLISNTELEGLPLLLSVEYLSIEGSAMACAPFPDGSCRSPETFDEGRAPDPDLAVDLRAQADAFNAMIAEASRRPEISGFYARRYNPAAALHDLSASVNGKPARDVLWYWFQRITAVD